MKQLHKSRKYVQIIALTAVIIGLVGILPTIYYWNRDKQLKSTATPVEIASKVTDPAAITGHPNRLVIPSLNMDLPIVDGEQNPKTMQWTLSLDKVHFATITQEPNDKAGNTFIYGHYRPNVFARLHNIKSGAKVNIYTSNGHVFTYTFSSSKVVDPSDGSLFSYTGAPILTLQTCTGTFMQNRQLFTFSLDGVTNA